VFDPAHFIMETGVLHGLKARAERWPQVSTAISPNRMEVVR
jgi:hypothetical protein